MEASHACDEGLANTSLFCDRPKTGQVERRTVASGDVRIHPRHRRRKEDHLPVLAHSLHGNSPLAEHRPLTMFEHFHASYDRGSANARADDLAADASFLPICPVPSE